MNLKYFLTACFFGMVSTTASAGPAEDAKFIVEQHIIYGEYVEKFEILEQDLLEFFQPAVENFGATIIDPKRFMHELIGEFKVEFMSNISDVSREGLIKLLSPQEITDLASFYRSDVGRELLSQASKNAADFESHSFFLNGPGAPLLERYSELTAYMEREILQFFPMIEASLTLSRMAEIFENPEIIEFQNEERRVAVVKSFRSDDP